MQGDQFSPRNLLISSSLKVNFLRLSSQNSLPFEPVYEYGFFQTPTLYHTFQILRRYRTIAKSDSISVVMSLCLRVTILLPLNEFSWNLIFEVFFFQKHVEKIQNMTTIKGNFCVDLCIFVTVFRRIIFRMRSVSDKRCTDHKSTHFIFSYFFRKSFHLRDTVGKSGSRQATVYYTLRHCVPHN